jgi:Lon protease-like protein
MSDEMKIPLFPLGILPIPKELIPLHIFEPKYRQLLQDVQRSENRTFGILFDHPLNQDHHMGAVVKVESVLKEYETGEKDIVVQCISNFILDKYYSRINHDKPYPGAEIINLQNNNSSSASESLKKYFEKYLKERDSKAPAKSWKLHDIANMLNLEVNDRINYIKAAITKKTEQFLHRLIKYHFFLLEQENKSRSNFYLN